MKNSKFILLAMFLTIASLLGGNALCASGVMHDANPKKHKTVSPKTDEVDAVNLVKTSIPLGSNTIYNLTNDGVLTIQYYNSRDEGTKFALNFSSSEATDRWVTRPGEDIRPYVTKVVFKANTKGVKIDFGGCNLDYFFDGFTNLEEIDFSGVKANSRVGNISHMFRNCSSLREVDLSWMTSNNTTWDMKRMFQNCTSLERVVLNNPGFKTRVTTVSTSSQGGGVQMLGMFSGCTSLKYVDMSNITIYGRDNNKDWGIPGESCTSGVRANLFADSKSSLEEVYFNNTKFEHVSYMCQMFSGASNLLRVEMKGSNIAPDLVLTNLMFQNCENLEYLDVSGLGKLNKIVNMDYFVSGCTNLKTLIIDSLDNSRIKPKNNYHKASTVDAGAAALASSADVDWGCQLGIESCTSLVTLSAKNAKVWMRYNKFGNPGNQLYDASSDENILYFTQRKTEFFADALSGSSTTIATKRDYIDLITDRDGVNMPSLVGTSANFPDLQTNINIKNGDLNTAGCGFLAPGVYNISNSPWDEIIVGVDSMTYYRIAYLQTRPYAVEGKEYAESKGLVFFEYNEPLNNKLHTHVNTVNRHYSEWGNSGSYVIDLSEEPLVFKYENAAIDVNGKLHDVNISISKITFKDLERIPTRPLGRVHDGNRYSDDGNGLYFRPIIRATQGDGIMFLNYARRGNPTLGSLVNNNENFSILTGGSGTEIEFKVEIDSANDGTSFVFNSNDLDVPESQEWFYPSNDACYDSLPIGKVYFGVGGESFELGSGNDLSTINFADHTGLLVVDNNKIITTGSDPSTSWSEFSVVANAKGANYKWSSGVGCTTYALRDTRPLNINTVSIQAMATKALVNDTALKANEFEFVLEEDSITPAGAPKPTGINFPATVTNAADGKILFNLLTYKYEQANPLIYDSLYYPGTSPVNNEHGKGKHNTFIYRYKLYEKNKSATKPEYAYDTTVRNIEILIRTPENEVELKKGILAVISVDGSVVDSVWSRQDTVTASLTTFRNKVSKLNLVKNWIDIDTNTRPADLRGFVTYNNGGADTTVYTESGKWVKANDTTWIYQIPFSSTATVKNWGEAVVPQGYDSTGRSRSNDTLFMTNTLKKFDVTIKNTVKGNGADSTRQFTFTIQIDSMASKTINVTILDKNGAPKDTTFTLTSTGLTTFKLKHGDSLVIKDIPYGTEYSSIIETDPEDYTVTSTVDYEIPGVNPGDPSTSKSDTATTKVAKHTVYSDHNVVFLNSREVVWLVKIWDDDSSRFRPTGLTGFVTYNNNGADTTVNTSSSGWTKLSNNTWIYEFVYPITATIKTWGETAVPTGYDSIGRSRSNDTLFMTNALKRFNITVFKTVKVDGVTRDRHRNQEFTYKFTLINHPNYTILALKNGADTILITGSDSVATFKLRDGDTMVLKNIPLGSSYMLEEIDYGFYTATTDLTGDDIKTDDANGGGYDIAFGSGIPGIEDLFIKGNQNIEFINSIRVIKLEADWNDEQDITGIRPDSVGGYIEYTYNGVKDTIKTGTWTKVDSVWTSGEFDIPTTATITNWGEETVPEGYEYERGTDTGNVYKFFNNLKYLDILVSKTVEVDGTKADRHTSKEFTYTLTTLASRTIPAVKNSTDSVEITTNAGGVATFKLKDADTMRLTRIPYGASYSVVEGDYGIYAVSSAVTGADTKTFDNTADSAAIVAGAGKDTITDSFLKGDVAIAYTNSIRTIKLEADWNDEQDITGIRPDSVGGYIEYTYNGVKDSIKTGTWTKVDSVWQSQEFDIPTTATVTNWGEETVPEGYEYERGTDTGNVYKFFNNLKYLDILVSKTVEVDGTKAARHTSKEFTYTLTTLANRTIPAVKNGTDSVEITTNAGGVATFKLKDADTMRLTMIPYGASYSVVEGDYGIYAVSSAVTGADTKTFDNTADSAAIVAGAGKDTITDSFLKGDVAIAYTNSIRAVKIEVDWNDEQDITGIRPDSVGGYIEYTYNGVKDSIKTGTWTKVDSVWTSGEFDIPTTATVTNWGEEDVPEGYEYERGTDTGNVYKFFNNLKYLNVLVSKTVEVDGTKAERHTSKEFTYTLTTLANHTIPAVKNGTDSMEITTNAGGVATFKLKDADTMRLTRIPYGASYSVVEGDYGIYAVSSAVTGTDTKTGDATAAGTDIVSGTNKDTISDSFLKGDVAIAYTNSIRAVKIEVDWNDEKDITGIRPDSVGGYIEYTYNGVKDSIKTGTWTKVDSVWTSGEFDIPTTATVTNWGEETVPEGYEYERGTDTGNVYKFFNNLKYQDILVTKTVEVDGTKAERHTSKEFTYTLTTLANHTIPAVKNGTDSIEITTNAGGVATFKLKDADTMRLTRIPYGASYSVVEGDYGIYAVSSAVTGTDTKTGDATAAGTDIVSGTNKDTISDSFLKGDVAIAYTNSIKVIKLEASWNDEQDITGIRPGNIDGYIEYTYKGVTDSLKTDNWVKVDTVWTQEFDFPTTATVTNWGEENVPTGYDFVKGSGVDSVYKFANNLQYFDLNVSNTVEVDGQKADRHKNKDFTYTVSTSLPGRTIVLKKTTASGDTLISLTTNASGVLSFTLKDGETAIVQDLPYGSTFSMNESDYDIYAVSSVVSDGSTTQNNNGSNVSTRTIKSDVNVAYTNKIMVLTLEKTWHDGGSPIRPENLKGYINYTYNSASGTLSTFDTAWVKTDSVWKHDFDVHVNTIVNNWGENTVPTGYEYARGERVGNVLKMANNLRKHNVTVKNTVSGDGADENKPFSYTMILKDPNGDPIANTSYTVTQTDAGGTTTTTTFTTDTTGKVTFQLKHNEKVEFHSFPYGTKYTISEGDYVPYTVTSKLSYYSGSELKTFDYTGPNVSEQNVFSNHTLIYNNHLQYVDVVFPGLPIQKRIVGRQWNDSDKFVFAFIPADDDNPMPVKLYTDTVNDVIYSPLTIAKDSTQGENEYHRAGSFGEITFTATDLDLAHGETEKTFVYHVRELHPAEGGVMIPYITYSVARYRVELTLYIDGDNKLALKDPVYKQEVVVNGHTTLTDAATPFIFTNVFDNVKKNHRVDAEKVLTSRGMTKHLKDFAYHFTLKPVGINADYAPMPENTDTLADNTRQYTASNENHAIRFYNDTPISDDNLGDGLLFDLTVLYPIFGRAELEAGVPFIYEISENIPDDCINNGDGTWQRTVTEDGKTYIDMYDGIVHYRQINVKYVEVGGEGTITTEAVASDDANFQDFYYTDQAKTQKHVLTDEEKTAQAMSGGAPVFHNYAIALRDIAVDKDWNDHDDEYKVRPASVTVRLLRDGVATGETVVLSESNSWAGKFENLQMGDRRRNYTYTVEEIVPNHYEPTYTVDSTHVSISNRVVSLGDDPVCGTIVGEDMFSSNPTIDCGTLTDPRDGQTYTTARINGYCWMTENLRYKSHYAKAYSSTLSPDGDANVETYGYLYNWQEAANLPSHDASPVYVNGYVHGICPEGWHLPTINEINVLHTYDAFALKSFDKWVDEGYNSSQFNALPGGYYNDNKERCEGLLTDAWFHGDSNTTAFCIQYSCCSTSRNKVAGKNFYSVRCVKDVH